MRKYFLMPAFIILAVLRCYSHEVRAEGRGGVLASGDLVNLVPGSEVVIAAGVTEIAPYAFAENTNVVSVRFEEGSRLASVGEYAFMGCRNLAEIFFPEHGFALGESALRECVSLRGVTFPKGIETLPRGLMSWCERLERVWLPSTLRRIGAHAFAYCGNLRDVAIPDGVEGIGSNAFNNCVSLQEIVIPASVKELESYAFAECIALRSAVMPANDSLLGELIFSGCLALEELTELAPTPPAFDCGSFLCEPDEESFYNKCVLRVPEGSLGSYMDAPGWKLMRRMEGVSE